MRYSPFLIAIILLSACSNNPPRDIGTMQDINKEMQDAADSKADTTLPESVSNALLPPLNIAMPKASAAQMEQRFDLSVNNTPASQVLMGVVSGTRYSMLVNPNVTGNITVNLKDVTVFEVLDALRTIYGYEYKLEGTRIFVEAGAMQTRVFQVNYITGQRRGVSDTRVTNGAAGIANSSTTGTGTSQTTTTGTEGNSIVSASVGTTTSSDFWSDLAVTLVGIVGTEDGRRVITNPQSGIVVVRGMPSDIRHVEEFLRLMQVNVERQVILEAKILSVVLNNQSQSGVNWALFGNVSGTQTTVGNINSATILNRRGDGNVTTGRLSSDTSSILSNAATNAGTSILGNAATTALGGPLFAVALQGASFAALLTFLDTQGDVQVLSSPRIATLNNQKAVLKVGNDTFFVTGISQSTTASVGATTTVPEVTLEPFFSGIALDVMPQIDKDNNIILHIHPSVSRVTTVNTEISLGGPLQSINLPLASSDVSETDSIVRTRDGQVIAIGGLMSGNSVNTQSKVPGLGDIKGFSKIFGQQGGESQKSELVILLKSTVVQGPESWKEDILSTQRRIEEMGRQSSPESREQ